MQLTERLAILKTIMLRQDLSAAAKQLAWFLLCERMNTETSLCFSKDKTLAADLNLDVKTIERAKRQLRQTGILSWTPQNCGATRASFYRFKKIGSLEEPNCGAPTRNIAGHPAILRASQPRNPAGQQTTNNNTPQPRNPAGLPNNTPDADKRIGSKLKDLVAELKATATNTGTFKKLGIDDAEQFKTWKTNFYGSRQ